MNRLATFELWLPLGCRCVISAFTPFSHVVSVCLLAVAVCIAMTSASLRLQNICQATLTKVGVRAEADSAAIDLLPRLPQLGPANGMGGPR